MGYAATALWVVREEGTRYGLGPEPEDPGAGADLDALEELGDEIATLAAHIHAATHRLLTLIARFDRLEGWKNDGFPTCAHWLAFRTGINLGAAREKVRTARVLETLPEVSAAMSRGELSFAKVRALTRVATPDNETELLELAREGTAAGLEKVVRAWRRLNRLDEAELERERHRSRCFSIFPDDDGMYVVRGRLDPEVGAALMRAVEAASDALYRAGASSHGTEGTIEPKRRRADAVGLLAERALAAGFGEGGEDVEDIEDGGKDATCDAAEPIRSSSAPVSGSRAERYQVVLHVEPATLQADGEPGRSHLVDGTRVYLASLEELADAHPECATRITRAAARFRGNVAEAGVRLLAGPDHPGAGRLGTRRGEEDPHDPAGAAPGARDPRRRLSLSRVRKSLLRRPPHQALGRRRRDEAVQYLIALSGPPQTGARAGLPGGLPRGWAAELLRPAGAAASGRTGAGAPWR